MRQPRDFGNMEKTMMNNTSYSISVIEYLDSCIYRNLLGRRFIRGYSRLFLWGKQYNILVAPQELIIVLGNLISANKIEGSLTMGTQKKGIQPSLVAKGAKPFDRNMDGNGYKLHLALDKNSYARLVWLQGALRAASFGEVLRRALDAYEVFDPEGLVEEKGEDTDSAISSELSADVEHLYVVISREMKQQLDDEKSAYGRTYKGTIRRALCVLMQLVRNRAKLVAEVEKGKGMRDINSHLLDEKSPLLLSCL